MDYRALFDEIAEAAGKGQAYRRKPLRIMAVTKTRDAETINGLPAEINLIGENKVQELLSKYEALQPRFETHFIGQLQSNKVKYILDKVAMIHSVDRLELAEEIQKRAQRLGKVMPVLCEVNISSEETKGGIAPECLDELTAGLADMPNVSCRGLMCVASAYADETALHGQFARMRDLLEKYRSRYPQMDELSMGMSGDYRIAAEEGATIIRLGTALFGKRNYQI